MRALGFIIGEKTDICGLTDVVKNKIRYSTQDVCSNKAHISLQTNTGGFN